jgi:basic membrane protein A
MISKKSLIWIATIASALVLAIILAPFGAASDAPSIVRAQAAQSVIGLIILGRRNEQGFYNDMYRGTVLGAKKIGAKVIVVDHAPTVPQQQLQAFKNLVDAGSKFIIVDGSLVTSAVAAAKLYPDVQFSTYLAPLPTKLPNLHGYNPSQAHQGYVLGVLAAAITKTKSVAFLGGFPDLPGSEAEAGYHLGVSKTNPAIKYAKTFAGSYSDPVKARQLASAQIANGADVIHGYVDTGLDGILQAAKAAKNPVAVFSAGGGRCARSPLMAADATLPTVQIMQVMVSQWVAKKLPPGVEPLTYVNFLKPLHVKLCNKYDTPRLRKVVLATELKLHNGQITIPEKLVK